MSSHNRWMNYFDPDAMLPLPESESQDETENQPIGSRAPKGKGISGGNSSATSSNKIQIGDLVTMTIVDVFETDSEGRLLSYCPTFDNRSVTKTNPTVEKVIKESTRVKQTVNTMRRTETAKVVEQTASRFFSIAGKAAFNVGGMVKRNIEDQLATKHSNGAANRQESDFIIPPAAGMLMDGDATNGASQSERISV
jgi:hypothetical protein